MNGQDLSRSTWMFLEITDEISFLNYFHNTSRLHSKLFVRFTECKIEPLLFISLYPLGIKTSTLIWFAFDSCNSKAT